MADAPLHEREHLALLYQASLEFNSTLDVDELLPRIFDRVVEALDAEAGSIWLREGDSLVCRIAKGPAGEQIEGLELPFGAGIVGAVARSGQAELVADAHEDERFVHQVDEATGFVTRSMVTAPLHAHGDVLGVLQVLNKLSGSGRFDEQDLALAEGFASTAGLALKNARLLATERRARDLEKLLAISRELTATFDVDRIALSVVNLASQALSYDRAAIALEEAGSLQLRAISGREMIDPRAEETRELERLVRWLAERGGTVYVPDVQGDGPAADTVRDTFGKVLQRSNVRALCLIPLADEEGSLGAFYMESATPDFLGRTGREAAELLANQVSVALRNAMLYGQVPFIGLLAPIVSWRRKLGAMPRERLVRRVLLPIAVVLALAMIPWRERIAPLDTHLLAGARAPLRATVPGLLAEMRVGDGERVEAGQVLAVLRSDRLRMEVEQVDASLAGARRQAAAALAHGDGAQAALARIDANDFAARLDILRDRAQRTVIRAPAAGRVLTLRPRERLGRWYAVGDTILLIGRTDALEAEALVPARDIARVRPEQPIRLKVAALPGYVFVGRVTQISPAAAPTADGTPAFAVRAVLSNPDGLLRPGMEARAKIVGRRLPLGYLLLRPLVRWAQLRFWW